MRVLSLVCALTIGLAIASAPSARAQDGAPPPAHISFVEGTATVDHDGESEPAVINFPVVEGDHIRTLNGRVEVTFPDGSSIAIDPDSDVEMLSAMRVRVLAGGIEHRPAPPVDPRSQSTQYLPPDLQSYGPTLDQNGSWGYEASYGNVWYPTVGDDWRPYYDGYWAPVPRYGLTWIGAGAWAWPTHHYGRWGFAQSRWFWIPGRSWSTAWVSWGSAPGYVSWCPLGFDNRAVFALSVGSYSRWNAWTVIPRDRFGIGHYSVRRYAVEPYRLASTTPFVLHRNAPALTPGRVMAVGPEPRNRGAVGAAVPRGNSDYRGANGYRGAGDYRGGAVAQPRDSRGGAVAQPRANVIQPPATSYQSPTTGRRQPSYTNQQPVPGNQQRANQQPGDNRAYRPDYAPRYSPSYTPNYTSPQTRDRIRAGEPRPMTTPPAGRAEPRAIPRDSGPAAAPPASRPSYRDERQMPREQAPTRYEPRAVPRESRPAAEPRPSRESRPATQSRPAPSYTPSAGVRGTPQPSGGPSHAREPHGGGDHRGGSSSGTATRRPR
jgi:hypothetical protein